MESIRVNLKGETPLILHNGQMANPFNGYALRLKEISSQRNKTHEHQVRMADIEWLGAHYWAEPIDKEKTATIPALMLQGMLKEGAKKRKLGKSVGQGVIIPNSTKLIFNGPQDPAERIKDDNFRLFSMVVVQGSRLMRTRPIYHNWELKNVEITYDPAQFNPKTIEEVLQICGDVTGLGEGRSWLRYGRFSAELV